MQNPKSIALILKSLTCQEMKILIMVGDGLTNKQIASQLSVCILTIKTHRRNIAHKAEAKGTVENRNFVREAMNYLKNTTFLLLFYYLSSIVTLC
jgi:DNA-binding NarL/FixJ family response regulator